MRKDKDAQPFSHGIDEDSITGDWQKNRDDVSDMKNKRCKACSKGTLQYEDEETLVCNMCGQIADKYGKIEESKNRNTKMKKTLTSRLLKEADDLLNEFGGGSILKTNNATFAMGRLPSKQYRPEETPEGRTIYSKSDGYTITNDELFDRETVKEHYDDQINFEDWLDSAYRENQLSRKNARDKYEAPALMKEFLGFGGSPNKKIEKVIKNLSKTNADKIISSLDLEDRSQLSRIVAPLKEISDVFYYINSSDIVNDSRDKFYEVCKVIGIKDGQKVLSIKYATIVKAVITLKLKSEKEKEAPEVKIECLHMKYTKEDIRTKGEEYTIILFPQDFKMNESKTFNGSTLKEDYASDGGREGGIAIGDEESEYDSLPAPISGCPECGADIPEDVQYNESGWATCIECGGEFFDQDREYEDDEYDETAEMNRYGDDRYHEERDNELTGDTYQRTEWEKKTGKMLNELFRHEEDVDFDDESPAYADTVEVGDEVEDMAGDIGTVLYVTNNHNDPKLNQYDENGMWCDRDTYDVGEFSQFAAVDFGDEIAVYCVGDGGVMKVDTSVPEMRANQPFESKNKKGKKLNELQGLGEEDDPCPNCGEDLYGDDFCADCGWRYKDNARNERNGVEADIDDDVDPAYSRVRESKNKKGKKLNEMRIPSSRSMNRWHDKTGVFEVFDRESFDSEEVAPEEQVSKYSGLPFDIEQAIEGWVQDGGTVEICCDYVYSQFGRHAFEQYKDKIIKFAKSVGASDFYENYDPRFSKEIYGLKSLNEEAIPSTIRSRWDNESEEDIYPNRRLAHVSEDNELDDDFDTEQSSEFDPMDSEGAFWDKFNDYSNDGDMDQFESDMKEYNGVLYGKEDQPFSITGEYEFPDEEFLPGDNPVEDYDDMEAMESENE